MAFSCVRGFFHSSRVRRFFHRGRKYLIIGGVCAISSGAIISAGSASAQAEDAVAASIARVEEVTEMLVGVIIAFVEVVIAPMGFGAAAKIFKHVVLMNV